ncbi:hypothetical protein [uncultured Sunxiuqinia sp.]|uniref:hypothetical protein n=1 Tax=uncultured Sunxiuqinia sp. TaxID=1573825 RepID=UPI002622F8C9|nr:hypothetical protein [uncultured Sunxiuqinia sp.]
MQYFVITTNKETAQAIEQVFQSPVLSTGRTVALGKIKHEPNYSTVQIIADPAEEKINPEDIFWMGFHSGTCAQMPK